MKCEREKDRERKETERQKDRGREKEREERETHVCKFMGRDKNGYQTLNSGTNWERKVRRNILQGSFQGLFLILLNFKESFTMRKY